MKELIKAKVNEIGIKLYQIGLRSIKFDSLKILIKQANFMDLEVPFKLSKERSIEIEKKYRQTINSYKVHVSMDKQSSKG